MDITTSTSLVQNDIGSESVYRSSPNFSPQSCSPSARLYQKRWMIMNVNTVDHVMAKFS